MTFCLLYIKNIVFISLRSKIFKVWEHYKISTKKKLGIGYELVFWIILVLISILPVFFWKLYLYLSYPFYLDITMHEFIFSLEISKVFEILLSNQKEKFTNKLSEFELFDFVSYIILRTQHIITKFEINLTDRFLLYFIISFLYP